MATNDARLPPQAEGQAETRKPGQAPANPRQMEGQTGPAAPQQGNLSLRDWASI